MFHVTAKTAVLLLVEWIGCAVQLYCLLTVLLFTDTIRSWSSFLVTRLVRDRFRISVPDLDPSLRLPAPPPELPWGTTPEKQDSSYRRIRSDLSHSNYRGPLETENGRRRCDQVQEVSTHYGKAVYTRVGRIMGGGGGGGRQDLLSTITLCYVCYVRDGYGFPYRI